MANANPYVLPEAFGKLKLSGWLIPAIIVDIDGCERPHEWAVQRGIGTSGAFTVWRGANLAETIVVTLEAPNKDTFDSLYALRNRIEGTPRRKPPTLAVENALFAWARITRVALKKLGQMKPTTGLSWRLPITFIEYNPQVIVPVGPADPAKPPATPTPLDEGERTIQKLAAQFAAL